ncbi:MAG: beta-ketoacyl-[acyl-carrier-protein] synthase family protein [Deltaproteobacteria bacterium]|nr:beta-ketoacyl-[acyl-carrier-protein] synthase family protein [Deltaproteobacteria bacterium]
MRRRVVATGVGTVSGVARDAPGFAAALREGRRGFSRIADPRLARLRATHAALVHDFSPAPSDPETVRALDRHVHLALAALREALRASGLSGFDLGPRAGVVLGTCSGGMLSIERHHEALARGEDPLDDALLFSKRYYGAARVLAWAAGAGGPVLTVVTACAAGSGAVAEAANLIRAGLADVMLAGGADAFAPSTLAGFDALKATCEGACAPFSQNVGLNLGEGAAFLVLEELGHALDRRAEPLAELLGFGLSGDAYHPTAPDPSTKGQVTAMLAALADAGVPREAIAYVNAHGTGTRSNDPIEVKSIARCLGPRAAEVPVSSTKSMLGHCLGGAGALEVAATILAARAGFVPPTAGFTTPREGCNVDCVPDSGRPWRGRIALSNSFGFGGNNACLAIDVAPENRGPAFAQREPAAECAVVTGVGLVSPLGLGAFALADPNARGIAPATRFETPCAPFPAGLVPPLDPREVDRRLDLRDMDRCSTYAALAARAALDCAGVKPRPATMAEVGLILGLATGPSEGEERHLSAVFRGAFNLESLGAFPYVVPNSVAGNVTRALMLRGHNNVLATGAGAGLAALVVATVAVTQGHTSCVLAGASDELSARTVSDGHKVGLFGPGSSVIPGEGAAMLLVERASFAAARGASGRAEILGFGLAADPRDPRRATDGSPLARCLADALDRAEVRADEVRAVATNLSGSPIDRFEREALASVLGPRDVEIVSLADRLGTAEAALPLFSLAFLFETLEPGCTVAATALSPEGLAAAVVLRLA